MEGLPAVIPPLITTLGSGIHRTTRVIREPYRTDDLLAAGSNRAMCGRYEPPLAQRTRAGDKTAQLAVAGMTPQATRAPPPPSEAGMSE